MYFCHLTHLTSYALGVYGCGVIGMTKEQINILFSGMSKGIVPIKGIWTKHVDYVDIIGYWGQKKFSYLGKQSDDLLSTFDKELIHFEYWFQSMVNDLSGGHKVCTAQRYVVHWADEELPNFESTNVSCFNGGKEFVEEMIGQWFDVLKEFESHHT